MRLTISNTPPGPVPQSARTRHHVTGAFSAAGPMYVVRVADLVDVARKAVARHSWREAYDAYSGSDELELTPEDQERFADAAWWTGRLDEAIALRERSYAGFSAAGDK